MVVVVTLDKVFDRLDFVENVGDIKKRRLLEADIDKGRLHAGQNPGDAAEIDIADDPLFPGPLDIKFGDMIVLEQSNPGLL